MTLTRPKLGYDGLGQYRLLEDYLHEGRDESFVVPAGFPTDLASVPRLFWSLIPPTGAYEAAAVLHDWHCVVRAFHHCGKHAALMATLLDAPPADVHPRDVDGLFRRTMRTWGVGFIARWLMWTGVRWGALGNPARRKGWWRDSPLVLAITLLPIAVTYGVIDFLRGLS